MRRLKLRELRILTTVAQTGSMGKAAAHLSLSQPARVQGSFRDGAHRRRRSAYRAPHGVQPTPYGRRPAQMAAAVFDDLSQAVREIESLIDPAGGEVRIGSREVTSVACSRR